MFRISVAGLRAHLLRTVLAAVAVALGVTFLAGTLIYADTAKAGFYDDFARHGSGVDVAIDPPDGRQYPTQPTLTQADLDRIHAVAGVAVVDGRVVADLAMLDRDGRVLTNAGRVGYAISVPDGSMSPADVVAGVVPTRAGEAALDRPTAARLNLAPGDAVTVLDRAGARVTLRLVGLVDFGAGPIFTGASVVMLSRDDLTHLTGVRTFTTIVVRAMNGTDPADLSAAIAKVVKPDTPVVTGAALRETLAQGSAKYVDGFLAVLLAGSLVALAVAGLVVYNTFSILAAQRTQELALLRCVGASRRQLMQVILAECLIVGSAAAAVGTALSLIVAPLIIFARGQFGAAEQHHALIVAPRSLVLGFVVGVAATILAGLIPAVAAGRVSPLAVLRNTADERSARPVRAIAGRLVLAVSLAVVGVAVASAGVGHGFDGLVRIVGGGMIIFLGMMLALPAVIGPLVWLVGWLPARFTGVSARLAVGNARRHPTRTAACAAALMIGVALVSLFTVVLATARDQADRELAENFPVDFELDSIAPGGTGRLPDSLLADLDRRAEFDVVVRARTIYELTGEDGQPYAVSAIDPGTANGGDDDASKIPVEVMRGNLGDLRPGTIAVRTSYAAQLNLDLGDHVSIVANNQTTTETVVAIYDDAPIPGQMLVGWNEFHAVFGEVGDQVLIRRAPAVPVAAAETALDQVLRDYPLVSTTSLAQREAELRSGLADRLTQFNALVAVSIVIAILGIMDTLALSVLERTRESATLRALGLSRRQLRGTILAEAVLVALIGGVIGVVFGVGMGRVLATSLIDTYGHGEPTVPVLPLLGYLGVAAVAGGLAALLPARRAGRTSVVTALADPG